MAVMPAKPELLAPAGDEEAMRAAVANGADAVYFGLSAFNARHRATNFAVDQLPQVMEYLHNHNVRGYVTFNTLIFSDELPEAVRLISSIAEAGVDAVIVQDLGLARLIRALAPTLPIHGSTQMTLTEPRGIDFVQRLGVDRVILARELSATEIGRIVREANLPVEVFIHGALCVSYSGQCLTSESIGGRSANRGQCAQACRLPYDLIVDGRMKDLGDKAYLLSPLDLAAYDLVADLANLGVCSFKIEGRLKSAHYVAVTTQTYRSALDAAITRQDFHLSAQRKLDLQQSYSRGFSHGFLDGVNHQELVPARFPKSRGVNIGTVIERTDRGVIIEITNNALRAIHDKSAYLASASTASRHPPASITPLKPGDGIVFDQGHPEQDEQGGRVFEVRSRGKDQIEIVLGHGDANLAGIELGSLVWKTDDPALKRRLEQSYSRENVAHRVRLTITVDASTGGALRIIAHGDDLRATATWDGPLQKAQKHPVTTEMIREQFGRLGDTPFELGQVELSSDGAMVPKSVLNDLRRQIVDELLRMRTNRARHDVVSAGALDHLRSAAISARVSKITNKQRKALHASDDTAVSHRSADSISNPDLEDPQQSSAALYVLARTLEQFEAALSWRPPDGLARPAMIYCELEDIRRYKKLVPHAHEAGIPIGLATTRIQKPGEEGLLQQIGRCNPDAVLVRNLAGLSYFHDHFAHLPLVADYSLNIANELTAAIITEAGAVRMVPSYDLNWSQMAAMFSRFSSARFEAVIHQHMPMFHMEHCVFSHTLSNGTDHRTCGRPCDAHRVDLRDRVGLAHPLVADVGCRNTVYNGQAQSAADYVPQMRELGLRHFRIELLRDNETETKMLLDQYSQLIAGRARPSQARRQLRVLSQLGVSAGTLKF